MNLIVWGLILDIVGVFVIILTEIINPRFGKEYNQPLRKTYWWNGWRPFNKNTKTSLTNLIYPFPFELDP